MSHPLVVNDALIVPAALLSWSAVRASGPGGQNVNKVASKVELRFDFAPWPELDEGAKARLRELGRGKLDAEGRLLIASQLTRDQQRNLDDAREKLRALLLRALVPPALRRPTRPTRASKARRLDDKRRTGEKKQVRRGGGAD
ncbi:alternative ribosome rescue aminoacyl-tRNA hydrolase ArfB [Sorangium sp. So ce1099]|uniref:alternative ribosome rescue aminoacyl-tRNA hydrolase ArfB n=1 Tax=Sorangium sp. So ce1099 TaxID=3133331 RepID=UPI003F629F8B